MLLQQPASGAGLAVFVQIGLIFAIFYFILIRPQRKRQKQLQEMIDNLKNGDKIITTGGLFGTVVGLRGDRLQIKVADNVKVFVSRSAVAAMQQPEQE